MQVWRLSGFLLGSYRSHKLFPDAFYAIVTKNSREFTGNICIDETVLRQSGVTDFEQYAMEKGHDLILDGFIDDDSGEGMSGVIKGVGIGADQTKSKGKGSQTETLTPAKIFDQVGKLLKTNPDIDLGAYQFVIDGKHLFLKNFAFPVDVATGSSLFGVQTLVGHTVKMFAEKLANQRYATGSVPCGNPNLWHMRFPNLLSFDLNGGKAVGRQHVDFNMV